MTSAAATLRYQAEASCPAKVKKELQQVVEKRYEKPRESTFSSDRLPVGNKRKH
jgi:hypothetical protein